MNIVYSARADYRVKRAQIPDAHKTFITSLDAVVYICTNCGFIEFHVEREE